MQLNVKQLIHKRMGSILDSLSDELTNYRLLSFTHTSSVLTFSAIRTDLVIGTEKNNIISNLSWFDKLYLKVCSHIVDT